MFDNLKLGEEDGEGGDDWDDYAMSGSDNDDNYFKTGKSKQRKDGHGGNQRKTRSQG